MIKPVNYAGEFLIEEIKFRLGITSYISVLPFIEVRDNVVATSPGVTMLNFDQRIFISLLHVLPVPALKLLFSEKQGCRKASSFYGFTYQAEQIIKLGFVQVLENYNNPEEQLFIFVEADFESDLNEKLQAVMKEINQAAEKNKSVFPVNVELKDYQLHCEIANILFNAGLANEALVEYRISLRFEAANPQAFYGIARIYEEKEDWENAVKYFQKTRNIDPAYPTVNHKLGNLNHKLGNPDQAIEDYSLEIEKTGDSLLTGYSHFSLGIIHEEKKKLGKAISQYKKAIKARPNYDFAYYKLGAIYFQKGDYSQAIRYFEKAIGLRPNNFIYYDFIALSYSRCGDFPKAIWAYKMALKINENDIRTLMNLGFTYSMNDDFKHAILTYRKALLLNPENPEIYYFIGLAYASHDKPLEEALAYYQKALSLDPRHLDARNQAGLIYYIFKDYPKAIKEYQACIRYNPGYVLAYKNLGLLYFETKKLENAIDYYSKAIALEEIDFECYYNRGVAYFQKENWKNAVTDLKKAEELNPNYERVKELLAAAEKNYLVEMENLGSLKESIQQNISRLEDDM
jgi:tetratricopeptide (TPR) repeat protein